MGHRDTVVLESRSRLAHLPPRGVGTAQAECLTSYVTRLADEYCVEVGTLVRREVEGLLEEAHHRGRRPAGVNEYSAANWAALNGVGTTARAWIQSLSALTLRSDLIGLTLIPWAAGLPPKGLLRRFRAWCPGCFQEWRSAEVPAYDPLLWAIAAVRVCPRHRRPLALRCPNPVCGRAVPWLSARARPGCCGWCGQWLGGVQSSPGGRGDFALRRPPARPVYASTSGGRVPRRAARARGRCAARPAPRRGGAGGAPALRGERGRARPPARRAEEHRVGMAGRDSTATISPTIGPAAASGPGARCPAAAAPGRAAARYRQYSRGDRWGVGVAHEPPEPREWAFGDAGVGAGAPCASVRDDARRVGRGTGITAGTRRGAGGTVALGLSPMSGPRASRLGWAPD
jgi:hypothetical protein